MRRKRIKENNRKPMTTEGIKKINELYDSGMTSKEISEVLGYSKSNIAKYVERPRRRGTRDK